MAATATTPTTTPTAIGTVLLDFAFCCGVALGPEAVDDVCATGVSVTTTVLPGAMLVTTEGCAVVCVGVSVVWLFWVFAVDDGAADDDAEDCELEPDCPDDPDPDALPTLLETPVR